MFGIEKTGIIIYESTKKKGLKIRFQEAHKVFDLGI